MAPPGAATRRDGNFLHVLRTISVRTLFFALGVIQGLLLMFVLLTEDMGFDAELQVALGMILCLFLAVGNAVSKEIRCWALLTIPSFCGRAGRHVLRAVVLTLLIAGPLKNMTLNGREVIHSFACGARLTYNLSRTRWDLVYAPIHRALMGMRIDTSPLKDVAHEIQSAIDAGRAAIKTNPENAKSRPNEGEADKYNRIFRENMEERCKGMFARAGQKCTDIFESAYDKCTQKVSPIASWLLCWPIKVHLVCSVLKVLGKCDASSAVPKEFGDAYASLGNASGVFDDEFDVGIAYEMKELKATVDAQGPQEAQARMIHEFERKREAYDYVMLVVRRLLTLVFLKVVFEAQAYQDGYLDNLQFDNRYVTAYFRTLDARRHARGDSTLLPLRRVERMKLVEAGSIIPPPSERASLFTGIVVLFVEATAPVALLMLDWLIAQVLDSVHRHGVISFTQRGRHDLALRIRGTGLAARLIRKIVKEFEFSVRVETRYSTEPCLPTVHRLHWSYIAKLAACFIGLAVLLVIGTHSQRISRAICAAFYPRREKVRVLHLYNETLKRRYGLLRYMRARVVREAREHTLEQSTNFWVNVCTRCPKVCWLVRCRCCRKQCAVCKEVEDRWPKGDGKFYSCGNRGCGLHFCADCWRTSGQVCLRCEALSNPEDVERDLDKDPLLGLDHPPDDVPP